MILSLIKDKLKYLAIYGKVLLNSALPFFVLFRQPFE